jgi:hypothetical protein
MANQTHNLNGKPNYVTPLTHNLNGKPNYVTPLMYPQFKWQTIGDKDGHEMANKP